MHELSIAISLVDAAEEEAGRLGGSVSAIHIKLGPLSGVVKSALLSAFELAVEGSPIQGARLVVDDVPLVIHCAICARDHEVSGDMWFMCPSCGMPAADVVRGKEMEMTALELES